MKLPDTVQTLWRSLSRCVLALLVVLSVTAASAGADEGDRNQPPGGKVEKAKKKKKKKKNDKLDVPIPVNHNAEGIKLPDLDENGRLKALFEIGSALRVNENELEMSNLRIETYADDGSVEMLVEMPSSRLHLETREVTSEKPITIRQSGFEITGGNVSFNVKTRFGRFRGPVKMLIYDLVQLETPGNKQSSEE